MVRQLSGRDRFKQQPYHDMEIPLGQVTSGDLQASIAHLDGCAVVGVAERFGAYLARCRSEFGWRITEPGRYNVTLWPRIKRSELSKQELAVLEKSTALDRVLYEHALKLGGG
jgi:hypothetical protein